MEEIKNQEQQVQEQPQITLNELVTWTEEQCNEFDKISHIPAVAVRNLVKDLMRISGLCQQVTHEREVFRQALANGSVQGYIITCPNCKVQYKLKPDEINYDKEITCQDCGTSYIQNENIFGVYTRDKEVKNEQ